MSEVNAPESYVELRYISSNHSSPFWMLYTCEDDAANRSFITTHVGAWPADQNEAAERKAREIATAKNLPLYRINEDETEEALFDPAQV